MKPQVLTMVTAERSPSVASVKPARPNSPRMFSLSTWFLEQPRLTRRTLRSRVGIAVDELLEARAVFLGTMDPVQGAHKGIKNVAPCPPGAHAGLTSPAACPNCRWQATVREPAG